MKTLLATLALLIAAFSQPLLAQSAANLTGTWKLVSAEDVAEKGPSKRDPYGAKPTGFLTYTADGRMSAIVTNDGRKPLSGAMWHSAPVNEQALAYATLLAYAGRYTLTGDVVTHHIEACSFPNWVNTDQKRRILKLEKNRLTLRTQTPFEKDGVRYVYQELIWERMQ